MKVLVCGGRDFNDAECVFRQLNYIDFGERVTRLIHGAASGADSLAATWAANAQVAVIAYPADWAKHGKAAGPIRNAEMLERGEPDLVLAFPGGRGTADMVKKARAAGVRVEEVTG